MEKAQQLLTSIRVSGGVAGNNDANANDSSIVPLVLDGAEVRTSATFEVTNPATGKVLHRCSDAGVPEAATAVAAAAAALPGWRDKTPIQRRDVLLKAAEVMKARRDELAGYMMEETGVPRPWADFNIDTSAGFMVDVAGRIAAACEGSIPATQDPATGALLLNEPYGVVLAIAPWNAPYILGTRSVLFPLAVGNTVVFKGSEFSPKTMWAIVSVLLEAGVPKGAVNFISSSPSNAAEVTSALIAHPDVKKINFTGSTPVGRIIGRLAGENLKPVVQELGGKAPAIVWEDADLGLAAKQCALGAFLNSGQVCMSTERILVHKNVRAAFETQFMESVAQIFGGTGENAPVLIQSRAVDKARSLVRDAVGKGAHALAGADVDAEEVSKTRMRPIVLSGVTPEMDIYKTESFGPTVSLIEIDSEEEALRIANDTEYGLSSAVFTEDLRRGLRFARGIETGAVHINSMTIHDESALPHGGAKASGYGRFNAAHGLREWLRTKTVTFSM